ncbi:MAG: class I SAM-dependent methyltransferase [Myxococcota bacterium]
MTGPMDPTRDERIGPTAHYTAYVWKRLGLPHAELFATPRGARLFWSFRAAGEWTAAASRRVPSMEQYLGLRHRLIEAALDEHAPDHVVELGAGLSRRGLTWAADRAVPFTEIDLPHMARAKRALLAGASPEVRPRAEAHLRIEEGDVLDPALGDRLRSLLAGARRPAVVAEGLVGYFASDERLRILRSVHEGLSGASDGIFLCDLRTRDAGQRLGPAVKAMRLGIRLVTRGRGIRSDFADDAEVRAFFTQGGFAQADKLDASRLPDLAHLPFPSAVWRARPAAAVPGAAGS